MTVPEVIVHQIATVTEQETGKASGEGTKWRSYVFKDKNGKELLTVLAFHTETKSVLEPTILPLYPL